LGFSPFLIGIKNIIKKIKNIKMAININYQNGGIGGILGSADFISGLIYDSSVLPSGFGSSDRIKPISSLKEAESLGISKIASGETKATGGAVTITAVTSADIIQLYVTPVNADKLLIGEYSVKATDTTGTTCAGLASSINLKPTGFKATVVGNKVNLTIPVGYGISLNTTGLSITHSKSAGVAGTTLTQFTGGVADKNVILHSLISDYFKANSNSKLWVGIFDFTSAFDASTIASVQTFSQGEIRQIGIWTTKGLDGIQTIVTDCQAVAVDQASKKKPLSVIIGAQAGTATLSTLVNLRSLTSPRVSVTIGNAYGTSNISYKLKGSTGYFPTDLGQVLGLVSRSKVSHSVAWPQNNLLQNADSMLVTGEKFKDIEDTTYPLELNQKGYIFQTKYQGSAGSYLQNDAVCDLQNSDYESIKRMRVMDKVARQAYFALVLMQSSPLVIDPLSGTISDQTINIFINLINTQLDQMATASEISGFKVTIDPTQNVLVTKNIEININVVPIGSADTITLNLGYALSIS
jgi:hypothetical protein